MLAHFCWPRPPAWAAASATGAEFGKRVLEHPPSLLLTLAVRAPHPLGRPSAATTKGVAEGRPPMVSFVLALNRAHDLALTIAHVLRLKKADVLALNKAHVLRLNTKICPVFTANSKEAAFGRLHQGDATFGRPPPPLWLPLCWLGTLGIS